MDIKIIEKPVIEKFIIIDGKEFLLRRLYCSLNEIISTAENDRYGDFSLRDYEISYPDVMDELVNMGLVKNYTCSRMANLYCAKDKKAIEDLLDKIYELDE